MGNQYCNNCNSLILASESTCPICGTHVTPYSGSARERIEDSEKNQAAFSNLFWGFLLIFIFGGITLGTYWFSVDGGFTLFLFGPVIYGAYRVFQGIIDAKPLIKGASITLSFMMIGLGYWVIFDDGKYIFSDISSKNFDHSAVIEPGECLDFRGLLVKCDSESVRFTVLSAETIIGFTKYPRQADLGEYMIRCSPKHTDIISPTEDSWADGDRRFLCVRHILEGESDIIQESYLSLPSPGQCLNGDVLAVKCGSDSAGYVVTGSENITNFTKWPTFTQLSEYERRCPSDTDFTYMPTEKLWDLGDRRFICVREK